MLKSSRCSHEPPRPQSTRILLVWTFVFLTSCGYLLQGCAAPGRAEWSQAKAHLEKGDYKAAIPEIDAALDKLYDYWRECERYPKCVSDNGDQYYRDRKTLTLIKAEALFGMGDYKSAESILLAEDSTESWDKAVYIRGMIALKMGYPNSAERLAKKLQTLNPDLASKLQATILSDAMTKDKNTIVSLDDLNQKIAKDPKNVDLYVLRAQALEQRNQLEQAIADYTSAIKLKPSRAESYYDRGLLQAQMGAYDKALVDLNRAVELQPREPSFLGLRGKVLALLGREAEALKDFNAALDLDPKNIGILFHRGDLFRKTNRLEDSLKDLNLALELNPKLAEGFRERGRVHALRKNYDQALADLTQALTINPKDPMTLYYRGYVLYATGKPAEAIKEFTSAITLHPSFGDAYRQRALVKGDLNQLDAAMEDLRQALKINPKDAEASYALIIGHLRKGNKADADSEFKRLQSINPNLAKKLQDALDNQR